MRGLGSRALSWAGLGLAVVLSTVFLSGGCGGSSSVQAPPAATLAISGVTLVDGVSEEAQTDMTVLIDGERIVAIGSAAELMPPPEAEVVDGQGQFLIPGLWDAHVHLVYEAEPAIASAHQLALYRVHGVVGVRDMGSDWKRIVELRESLARGEIQGPEIVAAGPFVDGPQPAKPAVKVASDAEEARQAVRSLAESGVDFVKIQANLSRGAYFAAVEEAAAVGLPVHGHVPDALTAPEVSAAGQRTIEHVSPALPSDAAIFFSTSSREQELRAEFADLAASRGTEGQDPAVRAARSAALQLALIEDHSAEKAAALFATLRSNGTRVVPTLIWSQSYIPPSAELLEGPPKQALPQAARERWEGIYERYFANAAPEKLSANQRIAEASVELVGALHRAGVEILAGSDSLFGLVLPGFALHQELELLVAAGLTPVEALRAATRGPAELLGQGADRGTVEVGKLADLVLLAADPLADIRNTRQISAVIDGGEHHSREALDLLLAEVVAAGQVASSPQ